MASDHFHSLLTVSSVHDEKKPFKCKFCPSYFAQKANLTIHMKSEHDKKDQILSCNTCNKSLVQNEQLNQHICNANFNANNSMNQHISKVHDKVKELKSPELKQSRNEKFLQASLLNIPLDHGGKKSFKCKFCPSTFAQKASLTIHRYEIRT